MKFSDWEKLTDSEQNDHCQNLSPSAEFEIFKSVESAFISKFGSQKGVGNVFCGLASGLGPLNAIVVEIIPHQPRTKLPKRFFGFPVCRVYERK